MPLGGTRPTELERLLRASGADNPSPSYEVGYKLGERGYEPTQCFPDETDPSETIDDMTDFRKGFAAGLIAYVTVNEAISYDGDIEPLVLDRHGAIGLVLGLRWAPPTFNSYTNLDEGLGRFEDRVRRYVKDHVPSPTSLPPPELMRDGYSLGFQVTGYRKFGQEVSPPQTVGEYFEIVGHVMGLDIEAIRTYRDDRSPGGVVLPPGASEPAQGIILATEMPDQPPPGGR